MRKYQPRTPRSGGSPGKPGKGQGAPGKPFRATGAGKPARSAGPGAGKPTRGEGPFGKPARSAGPGAGKPTRGEGPYGKPARSTGPGAGKPTRGEGPYGKPARKASPGAGKPVGRAPIRAGAAPGEGRPLRGKLPAPQEPFLDMEAVAGDGPLRGPAGEAEGPESEIVWGRHAVLEALKGERPVNKVWLLRGLDDLVLIGRVRRMAREKGAIVQEVERGKLNDLAPSSHQGLVASLAPVSYADFDELVRKARAAQHPLILVLDGIEDPHNLGALIRTAGAAGAQGVVIPRRRAVALTGTVAKAAAGALEHVPVARVNNLSQALEALKEAGFWVVGADQDAPQLAYEADLDRPVAAVVGAEGAGLARLTVEHCDLLIRFPMTGEVPSLNASVAGGLLLFEIVRQRRRP